MVHGALVPLWVLTGNKSLVDKPFNHIQPSNNLPDFQKIYGFQRMFFICMTKMAANFVGISKSLMYCRILSHTVVFHALCHFTPIRPTWVIQKTPFYVRINSMIDGIFLNELFDFFFQLLKKKMSSPWKMFPIYTMRVKIIFISQTTKKKNQKVILTFLIYILVSKVIFSWTSNDLVKPPLVKSPC